jgi:hypothetical protein
MGLTCHARRYLLSAYTSDKHILTLKYIYIYIYIYMCVCVCVCVCVFIYKIFRLEVRSVYKPLCMQVQ